MTPSTTTVEPSRALAPAWFRDRALEHLRYRGRDYLTALAVTGLCTGAALPFYPRFDATDIAMLYVLSIALGALRLGRGPAVLMSIVSVLALDYLFMAPIYSLDVANPADLFTLCVMLVVGLVIAHLVETRARLAETAEAARVAIERATLRNTLLASISHDLRTPLSAIAGAASLIAKSEQALDAAGRSTLGDLIERKAQDMSRLLTNVLGLARLESDAIRPSCDWFAVEDLFFHALRSDDVERAQRRAQVSLPEELPEIFVDGSLIGQIIGNLLDNATKHTPPGTTIMLSAQAAADGMLLVVADDGPGIPAEDRARVFESFECRRMRGRPVSTGLGLAICRAAARLHGGDISLEDNPGGGARFVVSLPVPTRLEAERTLPCDASMSGR